MDATSVFDIGPEVARERMAKLTFRERQVAELLAMGVSNDDIADRLSLSKRTVDIYRHHAKRKLGVRSMHGVPRIVFAAKFAG